MRTTHESPPHNRTIVHRVAARVRWHVSRWTLAAVRRRRLVVGGSGALSDA